MGRLFDFLVNNPILILILVAWLAGIVGNAGKAAQKARERAERAERAEPAKSAPSPPASRPPSQPAEPGTRSAEEVAREMRRILGLDREEGPERPSEPPPRPVPQGVESRGESPRSASLRPAAEEVGRREFAAAERPPTPVMPTTQERRITLHVDPHVGDRIAGRQAPQSGRVGKHEPGSALGSLGGRVAGPTQRRRMSQRYDLDNLPKALVLNEILGKPLALREIDDRFG